MPSVLRTVAAALAAAAILPAQQRPVTDVSGSALACQQAAVSPDGRYVAYRVASTLGVVPTGGGGSISLLSSPTLGAFIWSPAGTTLYVVDGNNIVATSRTGGGTSTVGTVPGQAVWLWDVDGTGASLFGTRYDPAQMRYHVFAIRSNGSGQHVDLFDSQDQLSDLQVDPSDRFLLYLQRGTGPFDPVSLMRANVDGTNRLDMLGAPLGTYAAGPAWIDAGDRAIVTTMQPNVGSLQVMRVDRPSQTALPLTWAFGHQRSTVSPDGQWILMESVDGVGGNGPALLPTDGGGEILLHTGQRYVYGGSPTADGLGRHVVWSAQRANLSEAVRVLRADLDGEMRVHPRAEVGRVLSFELPASPAEIGAILLGQRSAAITLAGIQFGYDLGPNFAILALAPGQSSGPIVAAVPLPNAPALQGVVVDFQGLRWDPVAQSGEWTRSGRFAIF